MGMLMIQEMHCVNNGMTASIFTKTESYLHSRKSHQKRLSSLLISAEYKSLMDMFFCIIFPEYKDACFQFYKDKKLPLRALLSGKQVELYDKILLTNLMSMRKKEDWEILLDVGMC